MDNADYLLLHLVHYGLLLNANKTTIWRVLQKKEITNLTHNLGNKLKYINSFQKDNRNRNINPQKTHYPWVAFVCSLYTI